MDPGREGWAGLGGRGGGGRLQRLLDCSEKLQVQASKVGGWTPAGRAGLGWAVGEAGAGCSACWTAPRSCRCRRLRWVGGPRPEGLAGRGAGRLQRQGFWWWRWVACCEYMSNVLPQSHFL